MSYYTLFKRTLSSRTLYLADLLINNLNIFAQAIITVYAGLYFNSVKPVFVGADLFIYYLFGAGLINVFQRRIPVKALEDQITMGNLAVHMTKPYNFIIYPLVRDIAAKCMDAIINFTMVYLMIGLLFGFVQILPIHLLRAAIIIPITILFIYLNIMIFMYLALLIERAAIMANAYNMMSFFLGGGLIAAPYLPSVLSYIPQHFYFSAPVMFILTGTYDKPWLLAIYSVLLVAINYGLSKYTMRRLELNGG